MHNVKRVPNPRRITNERLATLYSILAGIPQEKFDLGNWRFDNKPPEGSASIERGDLVDDKALIHNCGTTACAVGWAAAYPPFKRAGLKYAAYVDNKGAMADVCFQEHSGFGAVEAFFGVNAVTSSWLFLESSYAREKMWGSRSQRDEQISPKHVQARILYLLEKRGAVSAERAAELREKDQLPGVKVEFALDLRT